MTRQLIQRRDYLLETLEEQAGANPLQDRFNCGYIAAVKDFLNIEVEEDTTE